MAPTWACARTAWSLRYPDVSVFCGRDGPENDGARCFDDPQVLVEILSESTAQHDQKDKLDEYKALPSIATIAFVDPGNGAIRLLQRTGPSAWTDAWLDQGEDVPLPPLGLTVPHEEIFARD